MANHAASLRQALTSLEAEEDQITRGVLQVQRNSRPIGNALFQVLRPLMDASRDARRVGNDTLREAANLAQTAGSRLQGIKFEAGERGRASPITQQIARQAPELRQRGLDPSLLPSNATAEARTVVADAEALPADEREAFVKVSATMTAMRQPIVMQLRMATAALRAGIARWLGPLETLPDFLARTLGSRLTRFILVPRSVLKEMLRQAGVRSGDEA